MWLGSQLKTDAAGRGTQIDIDEIIDGRYTFKR